MSVDEGDAWSDEFRDLLEARLDVSIFLEPVKAKINDEDNDEDDETESVRVPSTLQNYNKNIRIERGIKEAFIEYLLPNNPENKTQYVYEPYEKRHQLTLLFLKKFHIHSSYFKRIFRRN